MADRRCETSQTWPGGRNSHPRLEPGIRVAVRYLKALGCWAYRGCEGHMLVGDSHPRFRHLGIVARDERDYTKCREFLRHSAARTNSGLGTRSRVVVEIHEPELHSVAAAACPTIDIVFAPQPGLADCDYFEHLALTYSEFCKHLREAVEGPAATRSATEDPTAADLLCAAGQFYDIALAWHCKEPADIRRSEGITYRAMRLHALNFALWHHEDAVGRPGVDDHEVARRKRHIDDLNAQRNAAIEDLDLTLLDRTDLNPTAPLYTETPATIVDRLSVLTLRILHANRAEQSAARLDVLEEQYDDLFGGLEQLLLRAQVGEIRFKLYRQFKSSGQRSYCALFEADDA
jgi:hypothetical protein